MPEMSAPFKDFKLIPIPGRDPARFGKPQFEIGTMWPGRGELSCDGVHAPLQAGIHGQSEVGAFSVVLSGGYEDDEDHGETFTYTGSGGREPRATEQTKDQEWTRNNRALLVSSKKPQSGGLKNPVRVIRAATLKSPYAPATGYRYDGLYTIEKAQLVKGKKGFAICSFEFRRCPNQPPIPKIHEMGVMRPTMAEREAGLLKARNNKSQAHGSTTIAEAADLHQPAVSSSTHGKRKRPYSPNTASKRIPFLSSNTSRDSERAKLEETKKRDDAAMDFIMEIFASASGASRRIGHQ